MSPGRRAVVVRLRPKMLQETSERFAGELEEIDEAFRSSEACDHVTQYEIRYAPHLDGCVVSLWDAWNRFLRSVVLASARGPAIGVTGNAYVPSTSRNAAEALAHLATNKRSLGVQIVRGEPNWYRVNELAAIVAGLGLSNGAQIIGAVGLSSVTLTGIGAVSNPLAEIQQVRNFIAHKNPASLADVNQSLVAVSAQDVHEYLWAKTTGGIERFMAWTSTLRLIADAACV